MSRLFAGAAAVLMTAMVVPAYAGLILIGSLSSNDDGSTEVITDSLNNYEWLRWDRVADLTYAQTLSAISVGGAYEGWQIAGNLEAQRFVDALIGSPNGCTVSGSGYCLSTTTLLGFSSLVGDSYMVDSMSVQTNWAWFLTDVAPDTAGFLSLSGQFSTGTGSGGSSVYKNNDYLPISTTDIYAAGGINADKPVGWLLYRTVPEPTTLALMGIGLAGIGYMRRKTA